MAEGRALRPHPGLEELRQRFQEEFRRLPEPLKALRPEGSYPVRLSQGLESLGRRLARQAVAQQRQLGES
jgi:nicotinate phosphoribosyltransferase